MVETFMGTSRFTLVTSQQAQELEDKANTTKQPSQAVAMYLIN